LISKIENLVKSGNIFLVGPMGAGKSTIGKYLAKNLKRPFYDSDKEIEKRTGVSIAWIFEKEGEQGFRERETSIIEELADYDDVVIATGGGAVLAERNREILRSMGQVVYLSATLEQLVKRTAKDTKRPLLQTGNPREKLKTLLEQRDPLYRQVADVIVRTGQQSVYKTVNNVLKKLDNLEN
jgi:shikimate kinase